MRRGIISPTDAQTIENTLGMILDDFYDETINTCEVGIADGETSRGINEYILQHGRKNNHTAVDNQILQNIQVPFEGCNFLLGNSTHVYYQIPDNSQHFIFVDANHSFHFVVADFFCYAPKVKIGGYIGFHDTARHIPEFTDHQWFGDKENPDSYIAVRKALKAIGLLNNSFPNWELVFDEADPLDRAGGVCIFKRLG